MGEGQEQKRPGRDPQGSPKQSRHRWVPCRGVAGLTGESLEDHCLGGQKKSWLEREGVGQRSDPLTGKRGEAEKGLRFDAWRSWTKRAAFRINGRRLHTGVGEGRSECAQGN